MRFSLFKPHIDVINFKIRDGIVVFNFIHFHWISIY